MESDFRKASDSYEKEDKTEYKYRRREVLHCRRQCTAAKRPAEEIL